jgi:hypothetical protein
MTHFLTSKGWLYQDNTSPIFMIAPAEPDVKDQSRQKSSV